MEAFVVSVEWNNTTSLSSRSYVFGYCSTFVASPRGYFASAGSWAAHIYLCSKCNNPTYFANTGDQVPGRAFGSPVAHIPRKEVVDLYNEARRSISVNAYTGSVLCCRKLLMSIAVAERAEKKLTFKQSVEFLADKGCVPPNGRKWVDHIKDKGNEATHEIAIMKREDAEELITFVEALLKFIYEYPGMMDAKKPTSQTETEPHCGRPAPSP